MSDQLAISKIDIKPEHKANEMALADLLKYIEPLINKLTETNNEKHRRETETDNEKHRRELEYETNLLKFMARQNRLMAIGVFLIFGLVFILAGFLVYSGQFTLAMDLIKLVIGLGGAAFGGYGWAMRKRRITKNKDE